MYWSDVIFKMYFGEGKEIADIVKHFNTPLVNEKYVSTTIDIIRYLRKERKANRKYPPFDPHGRYLRKSIPQEGTGMRKAWDAVEAHGGKENLIILKKEKSLAKLAEEWGIKAYDLRNYHRDFIMSRRGEPVFQGKARGEMRRRRAAGIKKGRPRKGQTKQLW